MSASRAKRRIAKKQGGANEGVAPGLVSVIAIDGPVAAGKTTVGQALAAHLGYRFLDTGLMYRAVTWLALQQGLSLQDTGDLVAVAQELDFRVTASGGREGGKVLVSGQDVTPELRSPQVESWVSQVSAVPEVRRALVAKQRALAREGKLVMVGRDIGTNVLPDAPLKVYLDASPSERATRRFRERQGRGESVDLEEERRELERRDKLDKGREVAPLRMAEDAHLMLTDGLSVEEVTRILLDLAEAMPRSG